MSDPAPAARPRLANTRAPKLGAPPRPPPPSREASNTEVEESTDTDTEEEEVKEISNTLKKTSIALEQEELKEEGDRSDEDEYVASSLALVRSLRPPAPRLYQLAALGASAGLWWDSFDDQMEFGAGGEARDTQGMPGISGISHLARTDLLSTTKAAVCWVFCFDTCLGRLYLDIMIRLFCALVGVVADPLSPEGRRGEQDSSGEEDSDDEDTTNASIEVSLGRLLKLMLLTVFIFLPPKDFHTAIERLSFLYFITLLDPHGSV